MLSISVLFTIAVVAVLAYQWLRASSVVHPSLHGDVLLVFAHPDDEAMFFTPLLHYLRVRGVNVHFLCLSNGNDAGLGKMREVELFSSGAFFGVQQRNIHIVNRPELQDGMRQVWSTAVVRKELEAYLQKAGTISTIVTFDRYGVSQHPNHIDVHRSVAEMRNSTPPGLLYYQLKTRGLLAKYAGPLAAILHSIFSGGESQRSKFSILIPPTAVWKSVAAMQRHASQLVWFRYLFVLFSSYTYINEFSEL